MATITTASIIVKIRGIIKDLLKTDGKNAFEYDTDSSFFLSEDRVSATGMLVYQNGNELSTNDWSFNADTNAVTITPVTSGVSLVVGDNIIITYNYYNKYTDSALTSYIKSSLTNFTQRQYKKTFYMNSSDEVVNLNGLNPTEAEGDIIAIITAINIDPNNVRISTRDFTTTPEEFKSKAEQIKDVFDQFTRSYGVVSFLEEEI